MDRRTLGHYRIVETLGEGGMSMIYRAEDRGLKRTVALQVLERNRGKRHPLP